MIVCTGGFYYLYQACAGGCFVHAAHVDYLLNDGPNQLGLRCNAFPEHQMALTTSGCVPSSSAQQVRTILQHDGPNHLGLWCSVPRAAVFLLAAQEALRRQAVQVKALGPGPEDSSPIRRQAR